MPSTEKAAPPRKRVSFSIYAPDAQDVAIAGDFSDWAPRPLKRDESGEWKATLTLPAGVYQYRYFIDGNWVDPSVTSARPTPSALNCVRTVR